jgi:hypothetical protein
MVSWRNDAASVVSEQQECGQNCRVGGIQGDLYMPVLSGCRTWFSGLASASPVNR